MKEYNQFIKHRGILIIVFFLFSLFSFFSVKGVEARSGCCSYHGGVCGCGCCDGSPLSSTCAPYYPECGGSGGYIPYQPAPSCPFMASYNSSTDQCECMSGYVASGNTCISTSQMCANKYGYNSEYDYLDKGCKCRYGYVWNSTSTSCIGQDEACQNQYGYSSKASISGDKCECRYGYTFNKKGTRCITLDAACQELNGSMSQSDSSGGCECFNGYEYDGSQCVPISNIEPTVYYPIDTTNRDSGVVSESVSPTKRKIKVKPTKEISPVVRPEITASLSASPSVLPTRMPTNDKSNFVINLFDRLFFWLFRKGK